MQVTFVPDASVFSPGINFDADTVVSRLRELAFLNAGATMKLRLLKNGQVLPTPGASSSKAAKQAAAAAEKSKRRSKQATAQQEEAGAAAGAAAGNGVVASSNGAAAGAAEEQGWQMFCYQEGLKEYVQW
jgi:DNA gyrase/topoisomerase IV subunit B